MLCKVQMNFARNKLATFKTILSAMSGIQCPPESLLRGAIQRSAVSMNAVSGQSRHGSTYRAALVTETGQPLQIQTMDSIDVPEKHVKVAIHHASINFSDVLISQGKYQEKPPLPFCPGSEFAGVVKEVGNGVTSIKVGDPVFGVSAGLSSGCHCEESIMPEAGLMVRPAGIPSDKASAFIIVYGTAQMALDRRAHLQPGETVIVTPAAGGVGLATVELATKVFNAKVIGGCGSDEKCEIAKSFGAYATINYNKESLSKRVKELTGGKGADVIIDCVGGDIFKECLRSIAFEGRLVVIGFASGVIPQIPANILLVKSCSAVGLYWGSYSHKHPKAFTESIQALTKAYAEGKINPHISKIFPLSQVNEGYKFLAERQSTGKVVLDCRS